MNLQPPLVVDDPEMRRFHNQPLRLRSSGATPCSGLPIAFEFVAIVNKSPTVHLIVEDAVAGPSITVDRGGPPTRASRRRQVLMIEDFGDLHAGHPGDRHVEDAFNDRRLGRVDDTRANRLAGIVAEGHRAYVLACEHLGNDTALHLPCDFFHGPLVHHAHDGEVPHREFAFGFREALRVRVLQDLIEGGGLLEGSGQPVERFRNNDFHRPALNRTKEGLIARAGRCRSREGVVLEDGADRTDASIAGEVALALGKLIVHGVLILEIGAVTTVECRGHVASSAAKRATMLAIACTRAR